MRFCSMFNTFFACVPFVGLTLLCLLLFLCVFSPSWHTYWDELCGQRRKYLWGTEFVIDIFYCGVQVKVPFKAKFSETSYVIMALCSLTVAACLGIVIYGDILPCTG